MAVEVCPKCGEKVSLFLTVVFFVMFLREKKTALG